MPRLLVKEFGPIRNTTNTWIESKKVTVFCGPQGSGKSTLVKLISEFSWLEKALNRGDFKEKELSTYDRFRKKYCSFHNIQNYFRDETDIHYEGEYYSFHYENRKLTLSRNDSKNFVRPQIIYIPAERNLLSALEGIEKVKKLPSSLSFLMNEYINALRSIEGSERLPLEGGYEVVYDKLNKVASLKGKDFKVRISESASGFQSLVPVILVSRYLQKQISKASVNQSRNQESFVEAERRDSIIRAILNDKSLDDETRMSLIRQLSSNTRNGRLVNIVEELEQNLYPSSQRNVLYELLGINNQIELNTLFLTTHSPYLINYLSVAMKAGALAGLCEEEDVLHRIDYIVPRKAWLGRNDLNIYEINELGEISSLEMPYGVPSDENYLNQALGSSNNDFEDLMELEEEICKR
ncbi:MAG: ATP-binding protein [Candidatus Cryptobacteroides sp.]